MASDRVSDRVVTPLPRRNFLCLALLLLLGTALALRLWQLDHVPARPVVDEATQGWTHANCSTATSASSTPARWGKEPLYIYLTAPFVAAWFGSPFAVRLTGALLSVLMVPCSTQQDEHCSWIAPTPASGLDFAAAALWATNSWAQSISRIGFQVNAFPLVLAVAVLTWLNYVRRPTRGRALTFGFVAGLTLYTYLAARVTPLLWLALFLLLPRAKQRALRQP